jgi:hypothetical protein
VGHNINVQRHFKKKSSSEENLTMLNLHEFLFCRLNGRMPNGRRLNGRRLNGRRLNGRKLNGRKKINFRNYFGAFLGAQHFIIFNSRSNIVCTKKDVDRGKMSVLILMAIFLL